MFVNPGVELLWQAYFCQAFTNHNIILKRIFG